MRRRTFVAIITGATLYAGALRLYELPSAGAVYMDDLRAYSGTAVIEALTRPDASIKERIGFAYRASIDETGARPALAWLAAIPAALGFDRVGDLYVPFALLATATIPLVGLLGLRLLSAPAGAFAAIWLAASAGHVNFARSAMPPAPATLFMVLGLLVLFWNGDALSRRRLRIAACGVGFGIATMFHPAYVSYLVLPAIALLIDAWRKRGTRPLAADALDLVVLALPTPLLVLAYDLPGIVPDLTRGVFSVGELLYARGWWTLLHTPDVYGRPEGPGFFPSYLVAAEGAVRAGVALVAMVALCIMCVRGHARGRTYTTLLLWLVVPWLAWSLGGQVKAHGRIYAPLFSVLALIVGAAVGAAYEQLRERRGTMARVAYGGAAAAGLVFGTLASVALIELPGRDYLAGDALRRITPSRALAWVHADTVALAADSMLVTYRVDEARDAVCRQGVRYIVLSPSSIHLAIEHRRFLFDELALRPVATYANPYKLRVRLMEDTDPDQRDSILNDPDFDRLGLYQVGTGVACHRSATQSSAGQVDPQRRDSAAPPPSSPPSARGVRPK
jgi:hypothetical protein